MVTLRAEKIKKGYSLFLDIYDNGHRKKKRLKLYVSKDYTKGGRVLKDDKHNWDLANKLKTQYQHNLDVKGTPFIRQISENSNFVDYFKAQNKIKNNTSYTYALKKLIEYKGQKINFGHIDIHFLNGFKMFLEKDSVSNNTSHTYLHRMRIIWKQAIKEKLTTENPFLAFTMPKKINNQKIYLSIEDIQLFANYKAIQENEIKVQRAFLFSCFTGLRISDSTLLKWSDIIDGDFIEIRQKKSKTNILRIPLHPTAKEILNLLPKNTDSIFQLVNLKHNRLLKRIGTAAISKDLSFHVARHTFATLLTTYGGDHYATQLLMGHSVQGVTAGYAQLTDNRKIEIINKIPKIVI